jgi:AraC-like DNA-binding protein
MKTLFSTAGVHPRDRFDCWHSAACKVVINHDSVPETRENFSAELKGEALGDVAMVCFENSPMAISHTARHIAQAPEELFICNQLEGCFALEQDSREVILQPGDITLLDPALPYSGRFFAGSKLLLLKAPRRQLEARVGKTREMTACLVKPKEGECAFLSASLRSLQAHVGHLGAAAQEIVKEQMLDLMAISLATTGGSKPRVSCARSLVLMQLHAAIDQQLANPALTAPTVAAAAGVSVRYANAILAEQGTSMMRLIFERRLARCRRAFEDPLQSHRTVSEIAYGWGFSDMTHFGRRFKSAYGSSPSEYRKGIVSGTGWASRKV